MYEVIQKMEGRHDGQYEWLKENHPEVFDEQKHIESGTTERAYWHHGYMMALRDTIKLLQSSVTKVKT